MKHFCNEVSLLLNKMDILVKIPTGFQKKHTAVKWNFEYYQNINLESENIFLKDYGNQWHTKDVLLKYIFRYIV